MLSVGVDVFLALTIWCLVALWVLLSYAWCILVSPISSKPCLLLVLGSIKSLNYREKIKSVSSRGISDPETRGSIRCSHIQIT